MFVNYRTEINFYFYQKIIILILYFDSYKKNLYQSLLSIYIFYFWGINHFIIKKLQKINLIFLLKRIVTLVNLQLFKFILQINGFLNDLYN